VAGLIGLVVLSWVPGVVGRVAGAEVGLVSFLLLPANEISLGGAPGGAIDLMSRVAAWIVAMRWWFGALLIAGLVYWIPRLSPREYPWLTWVFLFLLAPAVIATEVFDGYMQIRYSYIPAVGACYLAAVLLWGTRPRSLRVAVAAVLVVGTLFFDSLVWLKFRTDSRSPAHKERVLELHELLRELDA
jgi:hypothetical protein